MYCIIFGNLSLLSVVEFMILFSCVRAVICSSVFQLVDCFSSCHCKEGTMPMLCCPVSSPGSHSHYRPLLSHLQIGQTATIQAMTMLFL
jgi:hypothetical protein